MPKGYVETDHVNKDVFMQVLKLKKTSIRRLDEEPSIECSDKTIRRSLNNGKMRRQYIEQIAKYLDVDSRLLTGELVEGAFHTTNSVVRKLYLNPLREYCHYLKSHINNLKKKISRNNTLSNTTFSMQFCRLFINTLSKMDMAMLRCIIAKESFQNLKIITIW